MTRDEALELLRGGPEGVKKWNQWRKDNHGTEIPSLMRAELAEADLKGANLVFAHLEGAKLREAKLEGARLLYAHLEGADLHMAHLKGADLGGAHFEGASLVEAHIEGANLYLTHLEGADLCRADLSDAYVSSVTYDRQTTKFQGIRVATCHGNPLFKRDAQDQDYIESRALKIWDDAWRLKRKTAELKNEVNRERPGPHDNPSWQWWKKRWALWNLTYIEPVKLSPSRIWTVVWGYFDYGRDWMRVAFVALVLAIGFGLIYSFAPGMLDYNTKMEQSWFTPFYYSIVTYTTLGFGDITPITKAGQMLVTIEVVFGYLTMGLLISILANRVARRS